MELWEWFSTTAPAGALINALGLGALAALFATDRIITRSQHARRVADLTAWHDKLIAEKQARHDELQESRDYYRKARLEERDRADKALDQLAEVADLARLAVHALESLDEATREGG